MTKNFQQASLTKLYSILLVLAEREKEALAQKNLLLQAERQKKVSDLTRLETQSQAISANASQRIWFPSSRCSARQLQNQNRYRSSCSSLLSGIDALIKKSSAEVLAVTLAQENLVSKIHTQSIRISTLKERALQLRVWRRVALENQEYTDREEAAAFYRQQASKTQDSSSTRRTLCKR